jgi:hypothetical protein
MTRLPRLFWWLRPNTFFADGASVVLIDRFAIRYREGERSMLIEQDLQSDRLLVAIERASMRAWEPPHQRETVSEGQKDKIIENLRRAFATRGYRVMLLDPCLQAQSHPPEIA